MRGYDLFYLLFRRECEKKRFASKIGCILFAVAAGRVCFLAAVTDVTTGKDHDRSDRLGIF